MLVRRRTFFEICKKQYFLHFTVFVLSLTMILYYFIIFLFVSDYCFCHCVIIFPLCLTTFGYFHYFKFCLLCFVLFYYISKYLSDNFFENQTIFVSCHDVFNQQTCFYQFWSSKCDFAVFWKWGSSCLHICSLLTGSTRYQALALTHIHSQIHFYIPTCFYNICGFIRDVLRNRDIAEMIFVIFSAKTKVEMSVDFNIIFGNSKFEIQ